MNGKNLGLLSLAFLGADTVTNLAWGLAGDRFGFRFTFAIALGVWIGGTFLLMAAPALGAGGATHGGIVFGAQAFILMAFFALGAAQSGFLMSSQTMVLEFGARDDIPMRLALTTTAQGAMNTVGPLAGGLIAATLGYQVLFGVSVSMLTIALAVLLILVEETAQRNRSRWARQRKPRRLRGRIADRHPELPGGASIMRIGVPKEIKTLEFRIGATPGVVQRLCREGQLVLVEAARRGRDRLADRVFADVGAEILPDADAVFEAAEMIVKVKEPQAVEIARLKPHHILFTYLHLAADPEQARGLMNSGCTAIAPVRPSAVAGSAAWPCRSWRR